jgi:hypothetical protein
MAFDARLTALAVADRHLISVGDVHGCVHRLEISSHNGAR